MTTDADQAAIVAAYLQNAPAIIAASVVAPLPLPAACALIQMESGGANIYGHDKGGVFSLPAGQTLEVTETNFGEFLARIETGETSNGVGPCQITYRGYFPVMAARGLKAWVPLDNCRFGFELMAANYTHYGSWSAAGSHYNGGTNPDAYALAYGQRFANLVDEWTARLAGGPVPKFPPSVTSPPFIAAPNSGGTYKKVLLIVHVTVSPETTGAARGVIANWNKTRTGSTQFVVDSKEIIQAVREQAYAWAAGTTANKWGIHVEHCGYIQTVRQWADGYSTAELDLSAPLFAYEALKYGVPIRRLTVDQIRHAVATGNPADGGICGHSDITAAFPGETTHTDPGIYFPWDLFMGLIHDAADGTPPTKDWFDMATQADLEAAIVKHIPDIAAAVLDATVTNRNPDGTSAPMKLGELLSQIEVAEDRIGARLRDVQTALDAAIAAGK